MTDHNLTIVEAAAPAAAPRDQRLCELMGEACQQFAYLLQELHVQAPTFIAHGVVTETAIALGAMQSMFNETANITLPDTGVATDIVRDTVDSLMEVAGHINQRMRDEPATEEVSAAQWPFPFPDPADPRN